MHIHKTFHSSGVPNTYTDMERKDEMNILDKEHKIWLNQWTIVHNNLFNHLCVSNFNRAEICTLFTNFFSREISVWRPTNDKDHQLIMNYLLRYVLKFKLTFVYSKGCQRKYNVNRE